VEPGLTDTDPETGRVHLEMLRSASPHQRLRLALSLSGTVMSWRVTASPVRSPAPPPRRSDSVSLPCCTAGSSPKT